MGHAIPPFIVQHVAGLRHLKVDSRTLVFTLAVALITGILAGLTPALHVSRPDLNEALKEGVRGGTAGRGRRRLRSMLVASEVALALVVLVGAGLMVKGFGNMLHTDPGYDRAHVLTFHVSLAESKYREKDRIRNFYDPVLQRLQALPGVESAATATSLPSGWDSDATEYSGEGQAPTAPGELRIAASEFVSPDYFRALRVPLRGGHFITTQDGPETAPVVVISQSLARRIWAGSDPLGKHIKLGRADGKQPLRTVVGVVRDLRNQIDRPGSRHRPLGCAGHDAAARQLAG